MTATIPAPASWSPESWRGFPAAQMPAYRQATIEVEDRLASAAAVAEPADCAALRDAMAEVAHGRGFVLQGGDCAESFDDPVAEKVASLVGLFDAMAAAIGSGERLVEMARIAGQFAKPRSSDLEWRDGIALPSYRGDIVNGAAFDAASRTADPARMLRAHLQAVGTAASLAAARPVGRPIFTSHEALLLPYEEALTRRDGEGRWWATSGHMLWVGDRTRQIDGAHVEYLRGIENVVGVKCGPTLEAGDLLRLAERLNADNRPGKLALIGRFGAERIGERLPPLMRATKRASLQTVWMIDPMHGNTAVQDDRKLRRFDDIIAETRAFFAIARAEGVRPGGVHLEMSAEPVTECLGAAGPASVAEMDRDFRSACDPRLNAEQAVALAREIAALITQAQPQTAA